MFRRVYCNFVVFSFFPVLSCSTSEGICRSHFQADEEHRLSHIPFVSEDHDDKQFCAELRKLYDEVMIAS